MPERRFLHIENQPGGSRAFLDKLESIHHKIESAHFDIENKADKKTSFFSRIARAATGTPQQRMEKASQEWINLTKQMYPILSDDNGKPAYLSSFLQETGLRSCIYTDFYHIPEDKISNAYSYYEKDCTIDHSWLVKREAIDDLNRVIPQSADLWTHFCHRNAPEIAKNGISLDTFQDGGRVNLERNLRHYGDIGHVIIAISRGCQYKSCDTVFICNINESKPKIEVSYNGTFCKSATLSPEYICAVLTIEDGKISGAFTREEYIEHVQELQEETDIKRPCFLDNPEFSIDQNVRENAMEIDNIELESR